VGADLAWVYFRQGKYKEAEELYVQSLKVRQTALGDSHPDVARYSGLLASFLSISLLQVHHHSPIFSFLFFFFLLKSNRGLHDLAELYQKLGRYEEAEPLHQKYGFGELCTSLDGTSTNFSFPLFALSRSFSLFLRAEHSTFANPFSADFMPTQRAGTALSSKP
jgi:hypothetical protein